MSSSARKEEGYDDDDACMYAMLLSTFQVSEIASKLPSQHPQLHNRLERMLRVLASFSLLNSSVVVDHGVGGKVNIKDAIVDGGIKVFKEANGMSVWEYMEKDAKLSHTFNKAMAGISAKHMKKYLEAYDRFKGVSTQVDVGGGTGHCLKMIVSKYCNIKSVYGGEIINNF
ncbi:isoliquiritigenin 2'-O-methyltransferase-like [Arachis hypogaea]|nr:isoliquiritigenin 2'-O-methyltransferase-like [Arachis hypogaea]